MYVVNREDSLCLNGKRETEPKVCVCLCLSVFFFSFLSFFFFGGRGVGGCKGEDE